MKNRITLWLAASLVLVLGIGLSVPVMSANADRTGFTEADAEYYMPESVFGFFRPGVEIHFKSIEIPSDRQPVVTFDLTDPAGAPLDVNGVLTPGPTLMYFMLDYIPAGEEKVVSYCTTRFCYDRGGELTSDALGSYTYKFATVLPEGYDADAPHTLSLVARRRFDAAEFDNVTGLEPNYIANEIYNFIPSSGEETGMNRDVVTTESCNKCHNPLGMHGGSRFQEVRICLHCHNEDNVGEYAFAPMIHRVHSGNEPEIGEVHFPTAINDCQVCHTGGTPTADMPLVATPNPATSCGNGFGMTTLAWGDEGSVEVRLDSATGSLFAQSGGAGSQATGEWVREGQSFFLVNASNGEAIQKATVNLTPYGCVDNAPYDYTAYGAAGEMHTNWMTRPARAACGGCHVDIDWETGEGHPGGAQADDELCSFCHAANSGNEFDRSVKGAHTVPLASKVLGGVIVDIKEVTGTGPGQNPTVLFSLSSKNGPLDPNTLDRLLFTLTGPNEDFEFYAQENVLGGLTAVGSDWSYTFSARVPADAEGSYSVGFEGRITTAVNGSNERDSAENYIVPVAVTDAEPVARRMIVDDAKCEACHSNLSLHGDNRKNAGMYCQTCHRPDATDERVRLEGLDESIHFKYMVHKIHRGAELETLPYIIYGFRSSVHDYSHVHFPGDLRDCEVCHVNDSYKLPLPAGAAPTYAPSAYITEMGPATATCLSCHDSFAAAAHADANTSGVGESCSACHGEGKSFSVEKVHAR